MEEVAVGHTLVGPHKDDILINEIDENTTNKKNLMVYGSRGEQRLGVLFLKIGALNYVERCTQEKPIILLDDIFSELDLRHREEVLAIIKDHQCVITTAEEDVISILPSGAKVIRL